MKLRLIALPLCATLVAGAAEAPHNEEVLGRWSNARLHAFEPALHDKISGPRKNSHIELADYGSSAVVISRREGNGVAEAHADKDDYFIARSGEAILITGGHIVHPTQSAGEVRGDSVENGARTELMPGDIVRIPAGLPHQLLVKSGKHFTYVIINVHVETTSR